MAKLPAIILGVLTVIPLLTHADEVTRPNVLFIAIDDLNDWVGSLGGHKQADTPHLDRLASMGVNFTNAHCQAPICMPSRASLLTGTYPHKNGVYMIEQDYNEAPALKGLTTLPEYFRKHGYHTIGCGKIYHKNGPDEAPGWDEYGIRKGWSWMKDLVGPEGVSGLPEPSIFDFGPIEATDEDMNDSQVTTWATERLAQDYEKPFFLAVGLITPHLPLYTPTPCFDTAWAEGKVELPPVLPGDLDDMPPMGRKFTRYFDTTPMSHHNITRHGLWHKAVASYLACATFTDHCVGQLLDALEKSPHADNTVIVLWSDHGFHIGEKMHWEKRSLWEESTRIPLVFAGPGVAAKGEKSNRPVGLIDIYPTLVELCDLPENEQVQGLSLVPLLEDPEAQWDRPAIITHHPGNHAIRTERWRYIRYANGDEELYDHRTDPHEFHNLAGLSEYADTIKTLSNHLPAECAPYAPRLPRQKFTQEFDWTSPD